MLRAWNSASCVIAQETGGTSCSGHWVLSASCDITHETGGYELLRELGSASYDITHETGEYDLLRVLGSASCDITHETGGTICYGHWVLRLVISHTRHDVRVFTVLGFCVL